MCWCLYRFCVVCEYVIFITVVCPVFWYQQDFASAENYTVGYLTNIHGRRNAIEGLKISGAISYAIEKINNDTSLLKGHKLQLIFNDTMGDPLIGTRATLEQWNKGAIAIFGPENSCEIEAAVAAALNVPMLSYKCTDSKVSDREFYKTFARTYPSDKGVVRSILVLLKAFNWNKFSIIAENAEPYEIVARNLRAQALKNPNFTVNHKGIKFFTPNTFCCEDRKPCCNTVYRNVIDETYKWTRVYVFIMKIYDLIQMLLMMEIKKLLDKGEYVIIFVGLEQYSFVDSCKYMWRMDLKENEKKAALSAAHSLLVVVPSPPSDDYEDFENKVREYNGKQPFDFPNKLPFPKHISEFAAYLYDSVMLYAEALSSVLDEGEDPRNGTHIVQKIISKKRYKSVTGSWIQIDENGEVEGNYTVLSIQEKPANLSLRCRDPSLQITKVMLPVATFQHSNDRKEPVFTLRRPIKWISGSAPPDEPPCGFDSSLCLPVEDKFREVVAGTLGCIFFFVTVITWIIYRNWKYEQELAGLLWKIAAEEFQRYGSVGLISSNSKTSVLSQMSLESKVMGQVFTQTVMYKGTLVATKAVRFHRKTIDIQRETKKEMKIMREMHHDNINQFIGACLQPDCIILVTEYCAKGSLQDILENDVIQLDHMFIASLVFDLIKGMIFLHESDLKVHGNLKSSNCVVTSRWILKVTDFGLHDIHRAAEAKSPMDYKYYKNLLWNAPELLREPNEYPKGTQKADIYAFAIILHEILLRGGPFGDCALQPEEIVESVRRGPVSPYNEIFRPPLKGFECQDYIRQTMIDAWAERPENRPDFGHIRSRLSQMKQGMKSNIMDNMMAIMEKYANNLEELVDERTAQLVEEQKKTEALLHRMLPKSVAEQLIRGEAVIPESFDAVTIYFSDIVGFTEMSASSTPMEVVTFLNDLYTVFDSIIGNYDVYKVETIGDAYMVVSGLPIRNGEKHAGEIASMALELLEAVKSFRMQHRPSQTLKLRIGIHTGPVVAGVVGLTMPRYCLFGDTVNTASRMESNGEALKIHISDQCRRYLERLGGYEVEERGYVKMKGKGELKTYWLLSRSNNEITKSHPKDLTVQQPLFATREADNKRRSPKLDASRRGSMAVRGDSVHFRNTEDLLTSVPNGSVPGIPAFLRMSQESPRAPKRFSPQVNNRSRNGSQKPKDFHPGKECRTQCSFDGGDSPVVLANDMNSSPELQNMDVPSFDGGGGGSGICAFQESSNIAGPGSRRHLSGGDYRSNVSSTFISPSDRNKVAPITPDELSKPLLGNGNNNTDGKKPEIVDKSRLRSAVFRMPSSKRWRSCDEIELPVKTKLSFKDWFAGLFSSRNTDTDVRHPVNSSAAVLRPLKERDKEESLV